MMHKNNFPDFIADKRKEANKKRALLDIRLVNLFEKHIRVDPQDINDPLLERTLNDLFEVFRIGYMCGWNDCLNYKEKQ